MAAFVLVVSLLCIPQSCAQDANAADVHIRKTFKLKKGDKISVSHEGASVGLSIRDNTWDKRETIVEVVKHYEGDSQYRNDVLRGMTVEFDSQPKRLEITMRRPRIYCGQACYKAWVYILITVPSGVEVQENGVDFMLNWAAKAAGASVNRGPRAVHNPAVIPPPVSGPTTLVCVGAVSTLASLKLEWKVSRTPTSEAEALAGRLSRETLPRRGDRLEGWILTEMEHERLLRQAAGLRCSYLVELAEERNLLPPEDAEGAASISESFSYAVWDPVARRRIAEGTSVIPRIVGSSVPSGDERVGDRQRALDLLASDLIKKLDH